MNKTWPLTQDRAVFYQQSRIVVSAVVKLYTCSLPNGHQKEGSWKMALASLYRDLSKHLTNEFMVLAASSYY